MEWLNKAKDKARASYHRASSHLSEDGSGAQSTRERASKLGAKLRHKAQETSAAISKAYMEAHDHMLLMKHGSFGPDEVVVGSEVNRVRVTVLAAADLRQTGVGELDPYCMVAVGRQGMPWAAKVATSPHAKLPVCLRSRHPRWSATCVIPLSDDCPAAAHAELTVRVMDAHTTRADTVLGEARVSLASEPCGARTVRLLGGGYASLSLRWQVLARGQEDENSSPSGLELAPEDSAGEARWCEVLHTSPFEGAHMFWAAHWSLEAGARSGEGVERLARLLLSTDLTKVLIESSHMEATSAGDVEKPDTALLFQPSPRRRREGSANTFSFDDGRPTDPQAATGCALEAATASGAGAGAPTGADGADAASLGVSPASAAGPAAPGGGAHAGPVEAAAPPATAAAATGAEDATARSRGADGPSAVHGGHAASGSASSPRATASAPPPPAAAAEACAPEAAATSRGAAVKLPAVACAPRAAEAAVGPGSSPNSSSSRAGASTGLNEVLLQAPLSSIITGEDANVMSVMQAVSCVMLFLRPLARSRLVGALVDRIQGGKVTADMRGQAEDLIHALLTSAQGEALKELKQLIDTAGTGHDLLSMFSVISRPELIKSFLDHFRTEAKKMGRSTHVLSDIDMTVWVGAFGTGGKKFPQGPIPGAISLFTLLGGRITFLSARPPLWESRTRSALLNDIGIAEATVLQGTLQNVVMALYDTKEAHKGMGEQKQKVFSQFADLHPEARFVFFGDSGEGDVDFAVNFARGVLSPSRQPLDRSQLAGSDGWPPDQIALIHDVVHEDGVRAKTTQDRRDMLAAAGVYIFDTYVGAAVQLYHLGVIDEWDLRQAAQIIADEFAEIPERAYADPSIFRARQAELKRDLQSVNEALRSPGDLRGSLTFCGTVSPAFSPTSSAGARDAPPAEAAPGVPAEREGRPGAVPKTLRKSSDVSDDELARW